jgi:hypothetical protein
MMAKSLKHVTKTRGKKERKKEDLETAKTDLE